jgi:hypothetical protein
LREQLVKANQWEEAEHARAERAVVLAQKIEEFFALSGLGEGGVDTQVTKHDDYFAAMVFEDLFVPLRGDQPGDLVGALTQFAKRPWVLHRDDRLSREGRLTAPFVVRPCGKTTNFATAHSCTAAAESKKISLFHLLMGKFAIRKTTKFGLREQRI